MTAPDVVELGRRAVRIPVRGMAQSTIDMLREVCDELPSLLFDEERDLLAALDGYTLVVVPGMAERLAAAATDAANWEDDTAENGPDPEARRHASHARDVWSRVAMRCAAMAALEAAPVRS